MKPPRSEEPQGHQHLITAAQGEGWHSELGHTVDGLRTAEARFCRHGNKEEKQYGSLETDITYETPRT